MNCELSRGDLYITINDETTLLGDGIPYTEEIELSAKEYLSHQYHLNAASSISMQIDSANLELLYNHHNMPLANEKFTFEYSIPIMIQARWHKKSRIRKKWLKRFGMKLDTVKVKADAKVLEYHPGHILDEQFDSNGICSTFNSFDFETDKYEYVWRPDQKRKGLKIEWRTL